MYILGNLDEYLCGGNTENNFVTLLNIEHNLIVLLKTENNLITPLNI